MGDYQDTEAAFNHAPRQLVEKWPAACRTRQGRYPASSAKVMIQDTANDLTTTTGSVATVMTNSQAPPAGPSWRSIARLTAATPTFNISIAGTNLYSSAQTCTTTNTVFNSFSSANVASAAAISHNTIAASTGNKRQSITIKYKQL
jgi:hypothetical protein